MRRSKQETRGSANSTRKINGGDEPKNDSLQVVIFGRAPCLDASWVGKIDYIKNKALRAKALQWSTSPLISKTEQPHSCSSVRTSCQ